MVDDIFECVDPNGVPFSKTNNFVDKAWAMNKINTLESENARLREALKPLIEIEDYPDAVLMKYIHAAAAAFREGQGNE